MDSEQQRLLPAAPLRPNSAARQQATVPGDTSAASGRVARRRLRTEIIGRRTERAGRAFSIFFLLPLHKQGRPPHFLLEHLLVAMASPWRQPAVRACVCAAEPCDTYKTGTHTHTSTPTVSFLPISHHVSHIVLLSSSTTSRRGLRLQLRPASLAHSELQSNITGTTVARTAESASIQFNEVRLKIKSPRSAIKHSL